MPPKQLGRMLVMVRGSSANSLVAGHQRLALLCGQCESKRCLGAKRVDLVSE